MRWGPRPALKPLDFLAPVRCRQPHNFFFAIPVPTFKISAVRQACPWYPPPIIVSWHLGTATNVRLVVASAMCNGIFLFPGTLKPYHNTCCLDRDTSQVSPCLEFAVHERRPRHLVVRTMWILDAHLPSQSSCVHLQAVG